MTEDNEIFSLVEEKENELAKTSRQALIIQPGAMGDCILTLPLACFLKEKLDLGSVALMGNTEYTGFLPDRTYVNKIRSLEGSGIHRLFTTPSEFNIDDKDPLLTVLGPYTWIITFLGESGSDFEQNLIFAANCNRSVEVASIKLKADMNHTSHISQFYINEICREMPWLEATQINLSDKLITVSHSDKIQATILLEQLGISETRFAIIAPGSGSLAKCWPMENFIACADAIKNTGAECIFILGPAEMERGNIDPSELEKFGAVLVGPELAKVAGLCSICSCFLGNDSGLSHLAGASGTKTIAIFGPTDPQRYHPLGPNVRTIRFNNDDFAAPNPEEQAVVINSILEILAN